MIADITFAEGDAVNYRVCKRELLTLGNLISNNLPFTGTKQTTGDLDMGNKEIVDLNPFVEDDGNKQVKQSSSAIFTHNQVI